MACAKLLVVAALSVLVTFDSVIGVNIQAVLDHVPQQDISDFLRYYLVLGHELYEGHPSNSGLSNRNAHQFSELDSVSRFSVDLYKWALETRSLKNSRSYRSNVICFSNGKCVDISDTGVHP